MKKFNFRFEKILSYRRHQEKLRQRALAQVRNLEEKQKQEILGIQQDRERHLEEERQYLIGTINPQQLTAFSRYYLKLKGMEISGKDVLRKIQIEVSQKRQELIDATKQRKIYEKLKEKHKEKYVAEQNLLLQKENDEIGTKTYLRRK
ncbi:MAG: flagellar export protein FliJ [Candidatus Zixiibacteriota bacterium]